MYTEVTRENYKDVVRSLREMKKPASSQHFLLYERNRPQGRYCKFIYGSELNKRTLDGDYCRETVVNSIKGNLRKNGKYMGVRFSCDSKENVLKKTEDTLRNLFILLPFCERGREKSSAYVSSIIIEETQIWVSGRRKKLDKTWAVQVLVKVSPDWHKTPFHTFHFLTLLRNSCVSNSHTRPVVLRRSLKKVPFHGFFSSRKMEPIFERNCSNLWRNLAFDEGDRTFTRKVKNKLRFKNPGRIKFDFFNFSKEDSEKLINYYKHLQRKKGIPKRPIRRTAANGT